MDSKASPGRQPTLPTPGIVPYPCRPDTRRWNKQAEVQEEKAMRVRAHDQDPVRPKGPITVPFEEEGRNG
jgi:hypothetical protein